MYLIDIVPLTKIPHTQPQILSYFFSSALPAGALVLIPLGKRKETGAIVDSHEASDFKMEIKKAGYELRPISGVISREPILTLRQIELALWLGQYYFASPGIFAKMMMPKKTQSPPPPPSPLPRGRGRLRGGGQILVLTPTVAQTQKFAQNKKNAVVWHSELTKKQLNEIWWKIKNGGAGTIIGTRSAVFLPFTALKEIIIEDETNPNHRSWDMFPRYRVHEVAKKMTEIFGNKLIFKSNISSVESGDVPHRQNSGDVARPKIEVIDLRAELKNGNFSIFSLALQQAVKDSLAQKGQIILFINRRGAANFVLCRDCGYATKCANCDSPLAYHLINQKPTLFCHRCGHQEKPPSTCPQCQSWRVKTVGVGTQKVELEAKKLFSQAKIARLDSDSAPSQKEQQRIIEAFAKKEIDILIATQIIFSWLDEIKPALPATVALVFADTLLHLPDFRSGERTFQTITMLKYLLCHSRPESVIPAKLVPDRDPGAGIQFGVNSSGNPGTVPAKTGNSGSRIRCGMTNSNFIIQTYNPESSVIRYAVQNDWESFYQEEIETRKLLGYPPFSQIVKLTFRHRDPKKAGQEAKILVSKLKNILFFPSVIPAQLVPDRDPGAGIQDSGSPRIKYGASLVKPGMTKNEHADNIEVSAALPAFIPRERSKFVWNIIIKFKLPEKVILSEAPHKTKFLRGEAKNLDKQKMSSEFLLRRNSLLQYVPTNWEIDIDPSDLL